MSIWSEMALSGVNRSMNSISRIGIIAAAGLIYAPLPTIRGQSVNLAYVPVEIHQTVVPEFPFKMVRDGVSEGQAKIIIRLDEKGQLLDTLVLAFTREPFAEAAQEAVKHWIFEPAKLEGAAHGIVKILQFDFKAPGLVSTRSLLEDAVEDIRRPITNIMYEYRVKELRDLDRIPKPTHLARPVHPPGFLTDAVTVTVDFYIDETGTVRMASVNRHDDSIYAEEAVKAVAQWAFEPPLVHGNSVVVHATQAFVFRP